MRVLCSICARGGSTSLKNKNIKNLHGAPLIVHTLLTAKRSKLFDKLVVSSDSSKILKISKGKTPCLSTNTKKGSQSKEFLKQEYLP